MPPQVRGAMPTKTVLVDGRAEGDKVGRWRTSLCPAPTSSVRNVRVFSSLINSENVANDAVNLSKQYWSISLVEEPWSENVRSVTLRQSLDGPLEVLSLMCAEISRSAQRHMQFPSCLITRVSLSNSSLTILSIFQYSNINYSWRQFPSISGYLLQQSP